MVVKFLDHNNMELQQQRRRRQRERFKRNRYILAKQQLCTCITLFCSFFAVVSIFPISRTQILPTIPQIKWNLIWWIKFETVPISFFYVTFSVCRHPIIILPWQRDVTTSLYCKKNSDSQSFSHESFSESKFISIKQSGSFFQHSKNKNGFSILHCNMRSLPKMYYGLLIIARGYHHRR